jgi:hypothetical protein
MAHVMVPESSGPEYVPDQFPTMLEGFNGEQLAGISMQTSRAKRFIGGASLMSRPLRCQGLE